MPLVSQDFPHQTDMIRGWNESPASLFLILLLYFDLISYFWNTDICPMSPSTFGSYTLFLYSVPSHIIAFCFLFLFPLIHESFSDILFYWYILFLYPTLVSYYFILHLCLTSSSYSCIEFQQPISESYPNILHPQ